MKLLLGSHVREHGARVGRLAGFELEPADRRIRRIIVSADGELGPQAVTRPLAAIAQVHDNGNIEIKSDAAIAPLPAVADVVLLSRATRVYAGDSGAARLAGVEVNGADRALVSVCGRAHWWSKRLHVAADRLDCSVPGELRARKGEGTRAA
jgi:hypothetical protein